MMKFTYLSCAAFLLLAAPAGASDAAARYVYGDGSAAFTLDVSPRPYQPDIAGHLKIEGTQDAIELSKTLGVRGDVLYQNGTGQNVLRQRLGGGLTYYPQQGSKGVPVSLPVDSLSAPAAPRTLEDWTEKYEYSGARVKKLAAPSNASKEVLEN